MKNEITMKIAGALVTGSLVVAVAGCGIKDGPSLFASSDVAAQFVPASGDIEVDLYKPITVSVGAKIKEDTVNSSNIRVTSNGSPVPGTVSYDSSTKTITFTPTSGYPEGSDVKFEITDGVLLTTGAPIIPASMTFTTLSKSNLIAQWKFDGDATDSSGHGNDLTATNITYDSSTHYQGSGAAIFNGTNAFAATAGALDLGSAFTVTVWVKLANPVQSSCNGILTNIGPGVATNGFKVFINSWGTSNLTVNSEAGDGTNGAVLLTQDNFATVGEWKHLAFVVDKNANANGRMLFYYNGQPATQSLGGTAGAATAFPSVFNTNAQVRIGAFAGPTLYYKGEMDDMRVYNRVLTSAEILKVSQQR